MSKTVQSKPIPTRGLMRRTFGFTLIEMMIAVVLGILVSGGIISLFASTSRANRVQTHLARLQETGRFAVTTLNGDLQMVNAQYCSNGGGPAKMSSTGTVFQSTQMAPTILARNLVMSDGTIPAFAASTNTAYSLPSSMFLAGYDCASGACMPNNPQGIPAAGTGADDRLRGADVLTMRFLSGNGWPVATGAFSMTCNVSNTLTGIDITPGASDPLASRFEDGDLAMLSDCSQSQVFAVTGNGGTTLVPAGSQNFASANVTCVAAKDDGRLFDFSKDFTTITYFLQLKADDNPDAASDHLVGVLMRQVNDQPAEPLVRGVGRLDFRYGVADGNGRLAYLTANQVNSQAGGSLVCPPGPPLPLSQSLPGMNVGCLWRAVKSIEVNMLLNSVDTMPLPNSELAYSYAPDGPGLQTPPTTMTNGLDRRMMRRGFTSIVSIRNHNH